MVRTKKQHALTIVTVREPLPYYSTPDDLRRANEDKGSGARLTRTVCKRLVSFSTKLAPVLRRLDAYDFTSPVEFVAAVRACILPPDVRQTFERDLGKVVHPDLVPSDDLNVTSLWEDDLDDYTVAFLLANTPK